MLNPYPVVLNLYQKRAVVVGGGKVAERKVIRLVKAKAAVTVISPNITSKLEKLWENGEICWKEKVFTKDDLKNAFLIVCATNDQNTNEEIYEIASPNQLINVVDQPMLSNFIVPATFTRGRLVVSATTLGASPIVAKKIVNEIEQLYDDSYGEYLDFLFEARKIVLQTISDPKKRNEIFKQLTEPNFLKLTKQGKVEERAEMFALLLLRNE